MTNLLIIGAGGFVGAVCRFLFSGWVQSLSRTFTFPYGTLAVNVIGSFLVGCLSYLSYNRSFLNPEVRLFLIIGFLGAFTTFSSFSNETISLFRGGEWLKGLMNIGFNNLFCILAVWLGFSLTNFIWR